MQPRQNKTEQDYWEDIDSKCAIRGFSCSCVPRICFGNRGTLLCLSTGQLYFGLWIQDVNAANS